MSAIAALQTCANHKLSIRGIREPQPPRRTDRLEQPAPSVLSVSVSRHWRNSVVVARQIAVVEVAHQRDPPTSPVVDRLRGRRGSQHGPRLAVHSAVDSL